MGLILDTSVIVAVERQGLTPSQTFAQIALKTGNVPIAISVMTLLELLHGVERARTECQAERQLAFVDILSKELNPFPISAEIARLAGRIEGRLAARGIAVAVEDLLIGATALHLGFSVASLNLKHFALIPDLTIIAL
jgi:predicted nucleic acid-binding protein